MSRAYSPTRPVALKAAIAAILGASALAGASLAFAQEQSQKSSDTLEEITVTGSRIVTNDLQSFSPLITVDAAALENKSGLNIESYLNQLPNFNPSFSPTTTQGDVQISPVNSVGISAISLRGFGPNRSLVLIDGHRPTPINALMVIDINEIPSALIKKVEIISGGASATYGADALGGVTNFYLRDDFQGLEADIQYGKTTKGGDGQETRQALTLGTNFDGGRGNITLSLEHYDRKDAFERNRSFYTKSWADPNVASDDLFVFGYNGYNTGFFNAPNANARNAVFQPPAGTGVCSLASANCNVLSGFRFNSNGTMFSLVGNNLAKYVANGGVIDGAEFAYQNTYDATVGAPTLIQTLKWNSPFATVMSPQERYTIFASGKYDINDSLQFFSRALFAQSVTQTLLRVPANASFGWEAQIPYNPATDSPINPALVFTTQAQIQAAIAALRANPADPAYANPGFIAHGVAGAQHPVPLEMAALLNSRPNPGASWILETFPSNSFGPRTETNTNQVWTVETGLRFDLPFKQWTGEVYFSHGESSTYNVAGGNNSLTRWRAAVTAADYGRNGRFFGNANGASPNFGVVPTLCTSGFYETIFNGDRPPSEDCKYAVEAPLQTRTQNQQDVGELNLQGQLFELPAGDVRAALGFQYRKNAAQFNPDILQSTASFTDQVIGLYPVGYMDAEMIVKDYYGELRVPILSDLPFMKKLDLELGGRSSRYSVTDSTTTYKGTLKWEATNSLHFRGGYNRATRAPNLGELFLPLQEIFTGDGRFGDPCGVRSNSPFGAGGSGPDPVITPGEPANTSLASGQTAAGALSTRLICAAQMGAAAANTYYNVSNAPASGGGAFAWVYQQGTPDLESEKADTWTVGITLESPFENPWVRGLSLSIDWWKINIEDAIQPYTIDYARYLCYGTATVANAAQAAAQAATAACQSVPRNLATGGPTTVLLRYDNQATINTSGIDIALNWSTQLADLGMGNIPGRLGLSAQATVLDHYNTKQSPYSFDADTDWTGTLGPTLTGTNPGAYTYRLNTAFNYSVNDLSFSLRWRHLPSVYPAAKGAEDAIRANNNRVAAGQPGTMLSYTPGTWVKVPAYNIFDLSGSWNVTESISIRAGVDNLFDKEPAITGATRGYPAGTSLSRCSTDELAKGCVNPIAYSLPSTGSGLTSPGYYDVLGRRYFLGVKGKF